MGSCLDIDEDMYRDMVQFAMKVAKAVKQVVPCIKVGVAVIGLEVPHAHIHLVPMNKMDDINFSPAETYFPGWNENARCGNCGCMRSIFFRK